MVSTGPPCETERQFSTSPTPSAYMSQSDDEWRRGLCAVTGDSWLESEVSAQPPPGSCHQASHVTPQSLSIGSRALQLAAGLLGCSQHPLTEATTMLSTESCSPKAPRATGLGWAVLWEPGEV